MNLERLVSIQLKLYELRYGLLNGKNPFEEQPGDGSSVSTDKPKGPVFTTGNKHDISKKKHK